MEKKTIRINRGEYYVYVYLDTRKPGKYIYEEHKFLHEPIYVGKGKQKRAYSFERRNFLLGSKLKEIGKPVVLLIAQQLTESEAFSLEKKLILEIGREDLGKGTLCNLSDGGEGNSGRVFLHTEDTKKRISLSRKGQRLLDITKQKISKTMNGIKRSDTTKQKISKTMNGMIRPEETRKKMSIYRTGKKLSTISKKKISDSLKRTRDKMKEINAAKALMTLE